VTRAALETLSAAAVSPRTVAVTVIGPAKPTRATHKGARCLWGTREPAAL
jgi:hypothetical protein